MPSFRAFLLFGAACLLLPAAPQRDWKNLRQQIKATLHIPDPLPRVEALPHGQFSPAVGVSAERISYATDYGLRVPAIVYRAASASIARHPALIVVNGHGGDKSSWYAYWAGILYAHAGAIVLTYDPIGEFERNSERRSNTSQHDTLIPPDDMGRRLGGLMITDIMQAAHYLSERPDVDPKRMAVLGFSMGSFLSSLACAVDASVRACVLVGGGDLDGPGGYWDSSGKKMCQAIPYQSLAFLGDRGPVLFALSAKRGPTLVYNGTADKVVDIPPNHGLDFFENLRKQTIAELGSAKDVFDFAFLDGGGHRPYFLAKPVALWLHEKLNFPEWTKKQIQAMAETPMLEDRGASVLALSPAVGNNDIPVVPRDSLHAIPESLWETGHAQYVYETWVEHAQAAVRSGAP